MVWQFPELLGGKKILQHFFKYILFFTELDQRGNSREAPGLTQRHPTNLAGVSGQKTKFICRKYTFFTGEKHLPVPLQAVSKEQSDQDPVGRPMMHRSAISHATGEAVYCDDIPRTEGELFLVLVTSTRAHARIT